MPSEQACRHLGVGLTILKRVCRRFGIPRWPYNRQGRPEDGGIAESNGVYSHSGQQGPSGFGPAAGPGPGPQPYLQPFPQQLQGPQPNQAYAHAASTTAATPQPDWQQQQLQQALSTLFPQQQQQQQQQPASLAAQPAGVAQFGGLPLQGQQNSNQLLQATIAALQAAPPGTISSPAVQSLLTSLLGGALGGALAAGLHQQAQAAPAPPAPSQWGGLLALSQPAGSLAGQQAAPGGSTLQQLAALLEQPAIGRGVTAPVHPQPQPSNPTTTSALLSALGAGAAQSQPGSRPAAGRGAGSGSFDVRAAAADGGLGGAAAAAAPGAAASAGTVPSKPSSAQQDIDGWGSGGDSQGEDDEDLADFLEPGAQLPPRTGTLPPTHPSAAASPAPAAVATNPATAPPAATMQQPVAQPPTSTAPPAVTAQLQAQPAKVEQLEQQLLAALPDLQETATLLCKAAGQLQSHLLAQRLLKEHTASLGRQLPSSCQLLGVNAELAELCCTTLLNMLHGEGVAMAAAVQAGVQKRTNGSGSGTRTASGSGEQPSAPPQGSPQVQPGSSMAVGRDDSHMSDEASPKRPRCSSPAPAPAAPR